MQKIISVNRLFIISIVGILTFCSCFFNIVHADSCSEDVKVTASEPIPIGEKEKIPNNVSSSYEFPIIENDNLTHFKPLEEGDFVTRGSSPPLSNSKNISKKTYAFSGSSNANALYTNYLFYGSTKYKVWVRNNGRSACTVKAKRTAKTYITKTVPKNTYVSFTFSDIKKTTQFYLVFNTAGNDGYSDFIVEGEISGLN